MMNERIKELYGKACEYGLSFTACNPDRTPEHFARAGQDLNDIIHEKFAELIVKDYGNIVLHYANVDEGVAVANKHFGVE